VNVGSDYLLLRSIRGHPWARRLSTGFVVLGLALLAAGVGYYVYAERARSGLAQLVNQAPAGVQEQVNLPGLDVLPEQLSSQTLIIPAARFATLYPGQGVHPKYWASSQWMEDSLSKQQVKLLAGFRPATPADLAKVGTLPPATRMQIPNIDLDATVGELELLNLENALAWDTPRNLAGHIPISANPGEVGRGYFFGHLESPLRGEGSVFRRLPEIPKLLKDGEDVYIILSRDDGWQYLYRVYPWATGKATEVMHQSQFRFTGGSDADISLVTCVPPLVYSDRLIVNAELVGIRTG